MVHKIHLHLFLHYNAKFVIIHHATLGVYGHIECVTRNHRVYVDAKKYKQINSGKSFSASK